MSNDKNFNDFGYSVHTLNTEGQINLGAPRGDVPADVQAREFAANEQARRALHEINALGGLTIDDLREAAQEMMAKGDPLVRGKMMNPSIRQYNPMETSAPQQPQSQLFVTESQFTAAQRGEAWEVRTMNAKTRSGKVVPVYVVEDTVSGMTTGTKYRVMEVAQKVARIVNATGNPSDIRIGMLNEAHDEHIKLKNKLAEARRGSDVNAVKLLENKLQTVNMKIGL